MSKSSPFILWVLAPHTSFGGLQWQQIDIDFDMFKISRGCQSLKISGFNSHKFHFTIIIHNLMSRRILTWFGYYKFVKYAVFYLETKIGVLGMSKIPLFNLMTSNTAVKKNPVKVLTCVGHQVSQKCWKKGATACEKAKKIWSGSLELRQFWRFWKLL